ncbi:SagB/ThcOx family dehydrogenase [Candidatus Gottesmanbacteria bacterium]|nr:SagB/ThcOx family dehydrogenase [Candidatus Gottesmanbacteria bacterium]
MDDKYKIFIGILFIIVLVVIIYLFRSLKPKEKPMVIKTLSNGSAVILPEPKKDGETSVEKAIAGRRSIRNYKNEPLTLAEVAQILWAAQGITDGYGGRSVPSAGALYPLEVYIAIGNVKELAAGLYKYTPKDHGIIKISSQDIRKELAEAALGQEYIAEGAVDIVIAGVYKRTTQKYGDRGVQYVQMEAGHASQNIYLECESLGLGTVAVGAFIEEKVKKALNLPEEEFPLYIMPIGRK